MCPSKRLSQVKNTKRPGKFDGTGKHLQNRPRIVNQARPNNQVRTRLLAELRTAGKELERTKTVYAAFAQTGGVRALSDATAEYDCAINEFLTAANNFADFVLDRNCR
jgi:hypothetical protein